MKQEKFDTEAINQSVDLVELVSRYIQLNKSGKEYRGVCPWHADTDPSFYVAPHKNLCGCHPCAWHESAIGFLMRIEKIDFVAACKKLTGQDDSLPNPTTPKIVLKTPPPWRSLPAPVGIGAPDMATKNGAPISQHPYISASGESLGFAAFYASHTKPLYWTYGSRSDADIAKWQQRPFSPPAPLYGLMQLHRRPETQVLICHDERAADFAETLFDKLVVVTWPNGMDGIDCADWTILKGRKCVLLPRADELGRQAMGRVAAWLYENGATEVKGVDTEGRPEGWTITDSAEWTPADAMAFATSKPRLIYQNPLEEPLKTPTAVPDLPDAPTPESIPQKLTTARHSNPSPKPKLSVVDGNTVRQPKQAEIDPEVDLPPEFSEFGLAARFAAQHGEDWRYTAEFNSWHRWTGSSWERDIKNSITYAIGDCINNARAASRLTDSQQNRICTYKTVRSVASLVAARPEISMLAEQWDANPFEIGTPGGVVDLKTGVMREVSREAYVSRSTIVTPAPGDTPLFDKVLARASRNDPELLVYMWRWFGYILTGSCREESFLFCHGSAASGKSTMVDVISAIMGTYARSCKPSMFEETKNEGHPTELAELAGARLAYASESSEGARFHEARIKWLTGGDTLSARFMRADNFQFKPTHKIIIHGNHKPSLRSTGEEMRRRIHLIEFPGSIPEDERDKQLKDKLVQEYPAILHRMIQACIEWQQNGLGRPAIVTAATDEYLTGEDTIGAWLDDCIELRDEHRTASAELYLSFKRWAEKAGEYVSSQKRFSQKLEDRGFQKYRTASGRGFVGIMIKPEEYVPGYGDR
jgi:P4 family phage/plasmid primase-like protien